MRNLTRRLLALAFGSAAVLLSGCAMAPVPLEPGTGLQGSIHGGQQPIGNVTLQVYTISTANGSTAQPLFSGTVTSTPSGNFTFPAYTCPSPTALAYMVGTGGNPGLSAGANSQIAEMAVLGQCGSMTSSYINVNELTTVAAVYALAPYMSSATPVGSGMSAASGLANAFALAQEYVNTATGKTPGMNVPSGYTVPMAQIATAADIMASCINSAGGAAGDHSLCGNFIAWTTPTGVTPPTDTVDALLNLANNPTLNTTELYGMASSTAPYQPSDTVQPADFSIGLVQSTTMSLSSTYLFLPASGPGSSSQTTVTLMNTGSGSLNVTGIGISGTNSSEYTQTNNCGTSLAASGSCVITITFTPTVIGSTYVTLTAATTATNSPLSTTLSGTSQAGQLMFSPNPVTLPASPVGTASTAQPVTLTNSGPVGTVTLGAVSITGGTSDFSETNNCTVPLAVNAYCTIMVNVTPTSAGARSGTLTVASKTSYQAPTDSLTGTGTTLASTLGVSNPAIFLLQNNTGFIDLTNTGFAPLTISSIVAGSPFTQTNNCGTSLAVGGSCAITVTQPANVGNLTTKSLTINSNASVPQTTVALYTDLATIATGFGSVAIGSSDSEEFAAAMGGVSVTFSGVNGGDFTGGSCNTSYYSSCSVNATFHPSGAGTRVATGTIVGGYNGNTVAYGFGIAAGISVETITANPSSLTFPQTAYNAVSPSQTITLSNPAGHLLNITSMAADFQVSPALCAATSCPVTVTFAPASASYGSSELWVYDSATNLSTYFTLSGVGGIPVLSFSPSQLNFGSEQVGGTTASQTFAVNNTGDSPASLSINFAMGPTTNIGYSDFGGGGSLATVVAGTPYTLPYPYAFTPTGVGSRNATITITDSRSGLVVGTYLLTGTGTASALIASIPTSSNFGTNTIGVASAAQTVTITNIGNLTATLGTIGIAGANPGDFSQTNSCQGTLAAGANCSFAIVFTPGAATARSASLSIASNAPNTPLLVPLGGTGTTSTPALSFSATMLTFASGPVGAPSAAQTITVQNTGGANAIFGDIAVGGTNANDFSQQSNCNTLAPGASCSIQVVATPDAVSSLSGTLSVPSNVSGLPQSITLNATGTTPATGGIAISPSSLSFTMGGTYLDVTLTNNNSAPLTIQSIATSNSYFPVGGTTCGTTLAGGASCVITVSSTFTDGCGINYACPGNPVGYTGTLTVTDNGGTGSQTVSLSSADVSVISANAFTNTAVGSQSTVTFNVSAYEHEQQANFQGTMTGANAADFTPSSAGCTGPGGPPNWETCSFTVTFTPSGTGVRTAKLMSTASGVGYLLLTGTGTGAGAAFTTSSSSLSTSPQYASGVAASTTTFTLTNSGTTTLRFTSIPVFSSAAADFSAASNCTYVAAGGTCQVAVTFTASGSATTTYMGSVVLTDSTSGISQTIPITATATAGSH